MKRVCVVLLMLCLFTGMAYAQETVKQDAPHQWWNHPVSWFKISFDLGVKEYQKGAKISDLAYDTPDGMKIMLGDCELNSVAIQIPFTTMLMGGWTLEHNKASQTERAEFIKSGSVEANKTVGFNIYLTTDGELESLTGVRFAVETDKGALLKVKKQLKPSISVGRSDYSSWFNCHYSLEYALTDENGRLAVLPTTKWLKLWVISSLNRASATFILNDKMKVTAQLER
jgi:hypothetical protein